MRAARVRNPVEAAAQSRHGREVDDVGEASGDHQVGSSGVAILDDHAARPEVDADWRKVLREAKDNATAHLGGELGLPGNTALDQSEDAGGDPVLDHPAEANVGRAIDPRGPAVPRCHPSILGTDPAPLLDQAQPHALRDGARSIADVELLVDVREVRPHGGRAEDELLGDPRAGEAIGSQLEELELPRRQ
ncbi:MAG: hypothetical protein QOD14_1190 [Solirubrobacterales bacterium]|jgi:hypothetical protein|nr:hypothetical protein [Solirubrobacterales bacterium]